MLAQRVKSRMQFEPSRRIEVNFPQIVHLKCTLNFNSENMFSKQQVCNEEIISDPLCVHNVTLELLCTNITKRNISGLHFSLGQKSVSRKNSTCKNTSSSAYLKSFGGRLEAIIYWGEVGPCLKD